MLSNLRPQIVEEADRWEKLVEAGFRDLGLEKLVREGVEQKSRLNHVDDPLLVKRYDRMLELKACLQAKEFGKPRQRLVSVVEDSDQYDEVPVQTSTKKKRKTKTGKGQPSSSSSCTTKKKKKSTKKVSFTSEVVQST